MVPLAEIERKICKASILHLQSLARLSEFQVCAMDVLNFVLRRLDDFHTISHAKEG